VHRSHAPPARAAAARAVAARAAAHASPLHATRHICTARARRVRGNHKPPGRGRGRASAQVRVQRRVIVRGGLPSPKSVFFTAPSFSIRRFFFTIALIRRAGAQVHVQRRVVVRGGVGQQHAERPRHHAVPQVRVGLHGEM
jgi:hypothetical protein